MITSKESILNHLYKKYKILDTLNLINDEKIVHDFLSKVKKDSFDDSDRILIVQGNIDYYDFAQNSANSINVLQKFISQLDIPHYFIILLTPNKDILDELRNSHNQYSTEEVLINYEIYDGEFQKEIVKNDSFCILPWIHLYVGPDGNVLPCCVGDKSYPVGNILEDSIDNIIKSNKFNIIRENMLTGLWSKECNHCFTKERSVQKSFRLDHNRRWEGEVSRVKNNNTPIIETFNPLYIDIRLNNICNLKCRMCSGYFSSSIAQEDKELFGNSKWIDNSLKNKKRQMALTDILKYLPFVEKFYFAGGEPLLASEHYDILEKLIELGRTDVEISYNTNFTNLSFKNKFISNWWKYFNKIEVGASLDAMGDVAEYVRDGTIWQEIINNRIKLKEKCPNVTFKITSAVSFLTIESLIELQTEWIKKNLVDTSQVSFTSIISPEYMTCQVLPKHHKERLSLIIDNHVNWCKEQNFNSISTQWENVKNFMNSEDKSFLLPEFARVTKTLDNHRKKDFNQVFPQFSDLL